MYCLSYFIVGSFSVSYQSQSEIGQFKCFNPKVWLGFIDVGYENNGVGQVLTEVPKKEKEFSMSLFVSI